MVKGLAEGVEAYELVGFEPSTGDGDGWGIRALRG
jgi:hypothetical protein